MLWVEYVFREEYVSNKIHFGKKIMPEFRVWFCFIFFFFFFWGGLSFCFQTKHDVGQKSIFAQSRIYVQKRICFEQNSFWKKIMPEFRAWFLLQFFLFFWGGGLFLFIQSMNFTRKAYFVRQVFLLRVEFMLWVEYVFREEYVFEQNSFWKKIMPEFRVWFLLQSFFYGGRNGPLFVFSNVAWPWPKKHLWSDKYFCSE